MSSVSSVLSPPAGNAVMEEPVRIVSRQRGRKRRIYLSHSAREMYTTCGRKYKFAHVDRLESIHSSANLGFGKAVHRGCEVFLIHDATGQYIADPVQEFHRVWNEFCDTHIVKFSSRWDKEKLSETGAILVEKFIEDWKAMGLMVVLDVNGEPVLERKLRIELPDNVIYTAILDILAMTPDGKIIVVDIKTPGVKGFDGFTLMSEQLLGYQVVVDAHAESLGVDHIDGRAFYNLYKVPVPKTGRGEGPRVLPFDPVGRATDEDIADWINETVAIANDIRDGRFPKRPGDAFNSPCGMCEEFFGLCSKGDMEGLRKKKPFSYASTVPAPQQSGNMIPF